MWGAKIAYLENLHQACRYADVGPNDPSKNKQRTLKELKISHAPVVDRAHIPQFSRQVYLVQLSKPRGNFSAQLHILVQPQDEERDPDLFVSR